MLFYGIDDDREKNGTFFIIFITDGKNVINDCCESIFRYIIRVPVRNVRTYIHRAVGIMGINEKNVKQIFYRKK